jgi:hypothetical protein
VAVPATVEPIGTPHDRASAGCGLRTTAQGLRVMFTQQITPAPRLEVRVWLLVGHFLELLSTTTTHHTIRKEGTSEQ